MNSIIKISKKALWVLLVLAMPVANLLATHVVGGNITYECLGANQYEITLTFERDCINGIAFDEVATVKIFDAGTNNLFQELELTDPEVVNILDIVTANCRVLGEEVCVDQAIYKGVVTLPFDPSGYILSYRRCCRNFTLLNINDPLDTGATYHTTITEEGQTLCNSQAVFNQWPTIYLCQGEELVFDHSATDADGDSLVYRTCLPTLGGSEDIPLSEASYFPPFADVAFAAPYSLTNMMGGVPLEMNAVTGLMTATPNTLGQFLIGVCIDEYRNGVKIAETRRDFEYNVVACSPGPISAIEATPNPNCGGYTIDLENNSTIDDPNFPLSFEWIFDYPNGSVESTDENLESYTYGGAGNYTIALIATDGECTDTSFTTVGVSMPSDFDLGFTVEAVGCTESSSVTVTDNSTVDQGISSQFWTIVAGTETFNPSSAPFTIEVSDVNTITITTDVIGLTGCSSTYTEEVMLDVAPFEYTIEDITACAGETVSFDGSGLMVEVMPDAGLMMDGTTITLMAPESTTTYTYSATNGSCSTEGTFTITVEENPLNYNDIFMVCPGESVVIGDVIDGYDYSFIPEGLITIVDGSLVATGASDDVSVTIVVESANGCSFGQTVTINMMSGDALNLPASVTVCEGEVAQLTDGFADGVDVTFDPENIVFVNADGYFIVGVTENTTLTVTGNQGGCVSTSTVEIIIGGEPEVMIMDPISLCPGEGVILDGMAGENCTYTWMVDGFASIDNVNSSSPFITFTGSGSGDAAVVNFTIQCDDADCPLVGSVSILGFDAPSTDDLPEQVIVCGDNVFGIDGNDNYTYEWMVDECIIVDNAFSNNPTFTWTGSGSTPFTGSGCCMTGSGSGMTGSGTSGFVCDIEVNVSDENCSATTIIEVIKLDDPTEALETPLTVCNGESIELNTNWNECYDYEWIANPQVEFDSNSPNPTVTLTETTEFTVILTSICYDMCEFVGVVVVNVADPVDIMIVPDVDELLVCEFPVDLEFTISGTADVVWTNENGDIIELPILEEGCYTATATTPEGCESSDTICITLDSGPDVELTVEPGTTYCPGDEVTITSNLAGEWDNNETGISITVTPEGVETYCITVTDPDSGCQTTECVTLTPDELDVEIDGAGPLCGGGEATICVTAVDGASYDWSNGGSENCITVSPDATTEYCVTVTSEAGCTAELCTTVEVSGGPTDCVITSDTECPAEENTDIVLTASATGEGLTYLWSNNEETQSITVNESETFTYTVTITDAAGCTCEASFTCEVDPPNPQCCDVESLYIPNTFSPNGDGTNDEWFVTSDISCAENYKVMIYDRWGEQVYMSDDLNGSWDGTFGGETLNPDVYGYHLTFDCPETGEETRYGNITLLR